MTFAVIVFVDGAAPRLVAADLPDVHEALDVAFDWHEYDAPLGVVKAEARVVEQVDASPQKRGVPDGAGLVELEDPANNRWLLLLLP